MEVFMAYAYSIQKLISELLISDSICEIIVQGRRLLDDIRLESGYYLDYEKN